MKKIFRGAYIFTGLLAAASLFILGCSKDSSPTDNSTPSIVVLTPSAGTVITAGTQNYQITWKTTGIDTSKAVEYSLDNGTTWKLIGNVNPKVNALSWNVPSSASTQAMIRITDKNGLIGSSGVFTISLTAQPTLTISAPSAGEVLTGGTQNYQIIWSGTGIAAKKTLEYSLDIGATWTQIAVITSSALTYNWSVPNTASTKAIVRITDQNGLKASSGVFTITASSGLPVGETDATINGGSFKVTNTKTLKSSLTVTVTATLPKKTDATLDSVQLTLVIPIQGGLPYTIDVPTDPGTAVINYCIKQYPGGFCNSYKATKGVGSGTITITNLTPIIEGTFSGTLPSSGGSGTVTITNGSFKAQLN